MTRTRPTVRQIVERFSRAIFHIALAKRNSIFHKVQTMVSLHEIRLNRIEWRLAIAIVVVLAVQIHSIAQSTKDSTDNPPSLNVSGKTNSDSAATSTNESAEKQLPRLKDMVLPSAEQLLRSKPFDWIVLKTEEVIVVEPVSIRPDMPGRHAFRQKQAETIYNRVLKFKPIRIAELERLNSKNRNKELDELRKGIEDELSIAREKTTETRQQALKIQVVLFEDLTEPDFQLETRHIDHIVHFEDLLIRRADALIEEGNTALAYDLLLLVDQRHRENNKLIQREIEADERRNIARIEILKRTRESLRNERAPLVNDRKKEPEVKKIDNAIEGATNEIKENEEELLYLRKKLRFIRPADFPKPDPPQKDDLLLPTWPRFDELYAKLVVKDSEIKFNQNDFESAFRLLDEIWKPEQSIPGLGVEISKRMGAAINSLITDNIANGKYREARYFLAKLAAREPDHDVVTKWKADLSSKALAVVEEARAASLQNNPAKASNLIEQAALIWPETNGLSAAHRELTEKYQRLRLGIMAWGHEDNSYAFPSKDFDRIQRLTSMPLFEPVRIDETSVKYRSSFFEAWEPGDLGRQVRFSLKLKRSDWESRAVLTSYDIQAEVMQKLDPLSPRYDERFAGFVNGISIQSPSEFVVNLHRMPLRMESLWSNTVALQDQTHYLNEDLHRTNPHNIGRQRFTLIDSDKNQTILRRTRMQPDNSKVRRIEEIIELRYPSWEKALQALIRGEITAIPYANLRDVKAFQQDGRFFVQPYAIPESHFLAFHPESTALRDAQLRGALLHATPRELLLKSTILQGASDSMGRLVTSPFSSRSYGNNRLIEQPVYDPRIAAALALTVKKRNGGKLPRLKMICPADPSLHDAARQMILHWKRIGIEVELLSNSKDDINRHTKSIEAFPVPTSSVQQENRGIDGESTENHKNSSREFSEETLKPEWDIAYRVTRFTEPVTDIWPLLTMQTDARVDALQPLPERTRRMLLELERSVDWANARQILHRLLSDLLTEARYIPLWEIDEFFVARKNLVGLPSQMMHPYDDVEKWILQSWFPVEVQ